MERNALFESPNIGRLFFKIAIPGSIGMLASAIYQLIDGMFINMFLGDLAFTAVNLAFPFVIIAYAVADLIGVGSSVVISIRLGQKRNEDANKIFSSAVLIILIADILMMAFLFLLCRFVFVWLGAEEAVAELAFQYCVPYFAFLPLSGFLFSFDNFLRISGKVKYSMMVNILSSFFVIGLEALLLGVFDLPIWGASLATSLSFGLFTFVSIYPFLRNRCLLKFAKPSLSKEEFAFIVKSGAPAFLSNLAGRLTAIILNKMLLAQGGNAAVSVYGALMYIDAFVYPILYGMTDSLQPALGYNHGAGRHDRVKKLQNYVFASSFILCFIVFLCFITLPGYITYPFLSNADQATLSLAKQAAFIFGFLYLVRSFPYAISNLFQAIGRPLPSIIMTFCLSLVFPLALVGIFFNLGLNGIWLNSPVTYLLGTIMAFLFFYFFLIKKKEVKIEEKENDEE